MQMQGWGRGALQPTKKEKKATITGTVVKGHQKRASREYRAQLEKEIDKLQRKLKQEVDTHKALERAFRRTLGVLPRFSPGLAPKVQELLAEVAVLEEEVINLEECIVALRQGLYNEAVYLCTSKQQKAAAPNSFASSGTIEENCVKQPLQVHHLGNGIKGRMDSVIAKLLPSTIIETKADDSCSILGKPTNGERPKVHINRSAKEKFNSQSRNRLGSHGEAPTPRFNVPFQRNSTDTGMEKENAQKTGLRCLSLTGENTKTLPATAKVVAISHPETGSTLEPNILSEEMVWCVSHIFLKLTRPGSFSDCETSSTISQSTLSSLWSHNSRTSFSYNPSTDVTEEMEFPDPYRICSDLAPRDIGPYRYYHEIISSSMDYSRIPRSATSLRKLMLLIEKLSLVDLQGLTHKQKLAFWINIYNVCMMHAFLEHGIPNSPHKVVALMSKAAINVGGHQLSALAIEHFILRLPSDLDTAEWKSRERETEGIMRSTYGLEWPEPLVSFALCCGSWSSPAVRIYTPLEVDSELEIAKTEYLQAAVGVAPTKVVIPKLLDWYMRDFAKDVESLIDWISEQLPSSLGKALQKCMVSRHGKSVLEVVEVMPYDFNFRYLFAMQPL